MTRFEVAVPGGSIVGWREGSGPHVLVLHGGPGVSDYTASLVPELEDGYTVTRYQQRSVAPSTTEGPFDVATHVADAIAVLDGTGIDRAWLVGHSWGGHLALHLAVAHPGRFAGLVPVDPLGALGDGGVEEMDRIISERVGPEAVARADELDELAQSVDGGPEHAEEAFRLMWPGYFASPADAPPMPPMQVSLNGNDETFESIEAHLAAGTLARGLGEVTLPTVFVLGADSPQRPEHGIATASLMPQATYRIEGAGHLVWLDRPGVVRAALDSIAGSRSDT